MRVAVLGGGVWDRVLGAARDPVRAADDPVDGCRAERAEPAWDGPLAEDCEESVPAVSACARPALMMADPIPSATARTPIRPTYGEPGRSSESEFAGVGDRREYDGKSATDIRNPPTIPTVSERPFRCAKGFARHGFCCRRRKLPTPGSRVSLFTRSNADISVQKRNDICWH
jgi:hypothetical protein